MIRWLRLWSLCYTIMAEPKDNCQPLSVTTCALALADSETELVTKQWAVRQSATFLEWLAWNTLSYLHTLPSESRTDNITGKQSHCFAGFQDFIGCHVDFACSGISIGLRVFLWLMVCVFRLWSPQPESPEHTVHQCLKLPGCASGSCC